MMATFHELGYSSKDALKEYRYLRDADPPRIITYDNPYYYLDADNDPVYKQNKRLKQENNSVEDDIIGFADMFGRYSVSRLNPRVQESITPILEDLKEGKFETIASFTTELDKRQNGKFSEEYRKLTSLEPIQ